MIQQSQASLGRNVLYNFGSELSANGLYKNHVQFASAMERNLLPQHIYIILWINFTLLSMCCLSGQVQPEELRKMLVGDSDNLNNFFEKHLTLIWNSMQKHFNFLSEEIEHLIQVVMIKFQHVSISFKLVLDYVHNFSSTF